MAKNSIADYSATAASNTDIQSVDIDEGCAPSGINNAIRELMADLADMNAGTTVLTSPSASVLTLADGSSGAPALANTGDTNTGIFFPAADTVGVAVGGTEVWRYGSNPTTAKNLLQNGSFAIAQRGTSIAGAATNYYTLDRWQYRVGSGAETVRITTTQENNGGVGGHDKWIKALVATAEPSFGSGNAAYYIQRVEANSCLGAFDSSGMKALSISFDAIVHADGASSMSAPYALPVIIQANDGTAKQYVTNVSVTSADTWQHFTVSVPALAGATNDADNGNALSVGWGLATGSSRLATADTWETNNNSSGTSASENFADATNNYVGIANIQCEVGSVATDFEHEDYGTTLAKCLRYFWRWTSPTNSYAFPGAGTVQATTTALIVAKLPVQMRVAPSFSASSTTTSDVRDGATAHATTGIALNSLSIDGIELFATTGATLTAGNGCILLVDAGTAYSFSAEL